MGIVMMTGIMAIFEMGLSLTGQSLLPSPPDKYSDDMKIRDVRLWEDLLANEDAEVFDDKTFPELVARDGLCSALTDASAEEGSWLPSDEGESNDYFVGSCQLTRGDSHRSLVRTHDDGEDVSYQLFSCVLNDGASLCSFEEK